jgi:hypothetical protein
MIESVDKVNENEQTFHIQTLIATSSLLDVESVHLQTWSNVPNLNVSNLRP